jgi:predicted hotdog family 3-hydroxylacyl-ACP dehydratase
MSAALPWTLAEMVPHRPPMLLLDEALAADAEGAKARLTIRADSRFFDGVEGGVPAWVGIEYMAQTVAVWLGRQQLDKGQPVNVAFLLGTRSFASEVPAFPLGSVLTVTARMLYSEENSLGAFACRIDGESPAGGRFEVTARLNAFRPENPHAFVKSADRLRQGGAAE